MPTLNEIVGNNLVALRKARKLTQQEVGSALNYSDKSISKWELGNAIPSVDILMEFAEFYGVTVDFLLTEGSDKKIDTVTDNKRSKIIQNNKLTIFIMVIAFIWLVMSSVYISTVMQSGLPGLWIVFVWAVPASFFFAWVTHRYLWGLSILSPVLLSSFVATLVTAFFLQFYFQDHFIAGTQSENVAYIFTVLLPVEVIIALIYSMKLKK